MGAETQNRPSRAVCTCPTAWQAEPMFTVCGYPPTGSPGSGFFDRARLCQPRRGALVVPLAWHGDVGVKHELPAASDVGTRAYMSPSTLSQQASASFARLPGHGNISKTHRPCSSPLPAGQAGAHAARGRDSGSACPPGSTAPAHQRPLSWGPRLTCASGEAGAHTA